MYSFNILFVGRFIERKGVLLFLETAKRLPNFGFHLVGAGSLEQKVVKASKELKNVFYYGALMQSKKKDLDRLLNLYSSCDFLLSPYLYDEGFSATLIESLSCGTPVIVPKRGSPPTFLSEKVAVFLSENPSSKEIANVLSKIFKNKESVILMKKRARDFALKNFGFGNADVIINSY